MMTESIILNGRYQLEDHLGSGGMAMIHRARDLMLDRRVAIKIMREDFSDDPDFRQRFRQEARAAARLSHPNIITVHDFGFHENQPFIVMEYLPGTDLKAILRRRGWLEVDEALDLMIQACAGIGYAHRAGLIHCDIKPQNLLVTPDMHLKVTDFGIARAFTSILPDEQAQVVWGSPQYFSPEQASGYAPSPASDVYSLGVVLFEMLTGKLPFSAQSADELARMHRENPPASPSLYRPNIPAEVEAVILKVLSKEPAMRYRTADQMGRVLISLAQQDSAFSGTVGGNQVNAVFPPQEEPVNQAFESPSAWIPEPRTAQEGSVLKAQPKVVKAEKLDQQGSQVDWITWILALLAFIAVGGLIPFWLWVYYVLNPPG